jgi:hypothetical protein
LGRPWPPRSTARPPSRVPCGTCRRTRGILTAGTSR